MIGFRERLALYTLLTSLTALSTDALLPGLWHIGADLGVSPPLSTQHVISLFIFGMAFGELALGPLSDAIGRKKALCTGLCIYVVGTLIAMFAMSLDIVIIGRFLQGIGVAGPKIATRAMIRDQFEGDAMARVLSFMFTLFILVPMLAPALAQGLISITGWRSVFAAYLVIALGLGLWLATRHPETLPVQNRIPLRPKCLAANAFRILSNRRVSLLIIATGLIFGGQLLFISTAADLLFDAYRIRDSFPLYFAGLAIALGLSSFLNARLVGRFGMTTMARWSLFGLVFSASLMLAAHLSYPSVLPLPVLLLFLFAIFFAIGLFFGNVNALAMQPLGKMAGLGASLIASGSSAIATLFAVAIGFFYDGTATYLSVGFFLSSLGALAFSEIAIRTYAAPVEAAA